jgi:hypothetical protein
LIDKKVEYFKHRKYGDSQEKSHQSATVRDEIDEAILFGSHYGHELAFFEQDLDFVQGSEKNDR